MVQNRKVYTPRFSEIRLVFLAAFAGISSLLLVVRLRGTPRVYGFIARGSLLHSWLGESGTASSKRKRDKAWANEGQGASATRCWRASHGSGLEVQAVTMISTVPLPSCFDRCALVGSADSLKGVSLGREIDDHDTVIRVNRMPAEQFYPDFGTRTDVLFAGPRADGQDMFSMEGVRFRMLGKSQQVSEFCGFNSTACPFRSVIFKGADSYEHHLLWDQTWPKERPGWRTSDSRWAVAFEADEVNIFAYHLLNKSSPARPSNGLHAVLTFGLMCGSIDFYGFSGSGTADKHYIDERRHNLTYEHALVQSIMEGKAQVSAVWADMLEKLHARAGHWRHRP